MRAGRLETGSRIKATWSGNGGCEGRGQWPLPGWNEYRSMGKLGTTVPRSRRVLRRKRAGLPNLRKVAQKSRMRDFPAPRRSSASAEPRPPSPDHEARPPIGYVDGCDADSLWERWVRCCLLYGGHTLSRAVGRGGQYCELL